MFGPHDPNKALLQFRTQVWMLNQSLARCCEHLCNVMFPITSQLLRPGEQGPVAQVVRALC
jgi:hypothetical protein